MTKAELVDHVAATVQLSKAQTDAVLTQCLQAIIAAVQRIFLSYFAARRTISEGYLLSCSLT